MRTTPHLPMALTLSTVEHVRGFEKHSHNTYALQPMSDQPSHAFLNSHQTGEVVQCPKRLQLDACIKHRYIKWWMHMLQIPYLANLHQKARSLEHPVTDRLSATFKH